MNLLKSRHYPYSAVLAIATLSIGFTPAASAVSSYDSYAEVSLTLNNVTAGSWTVSALGDYTDCCLDFIEDGNASADFDFNVIDPAVSLDIGDTIAQTSNSFGMADDPYGWARSNAYTNLELTLTNTSDIALTFSFDFEAILDAQVEGGAIAETGVFIDGPNNTYLDAFAFDTADVLLLGDFDLVVAAGQDATILVGVDSFGEAFVPVPAAVWLFGSGLLGMIGIARRKQAA